MKPHSSLTENPFTAAELHFAAELGWLCGSAAAALPHSELEEHMQRSGLELYRKLLQGHLDLRAQRELATAPRNVNGTDGVTRTHKRATSRTLATLFGPVTVKRLGYSAPGWPRLHPADVALQLPRQRYSHPLQRRVAEAVAGAAYVQVVDRIAATTASVVPKRQAEQLVQAAAVDFEAFYSQHPAPSAGDDELLVLSFDGKGVPMRRIDLRPATARAAQHRRFKLTKRLSRGEKRGFKRMAEVATVYTIAPFVRTPADIVHDLWPAEPPRPLPSRPRPQHKRVWASLQRSPAEVITAAFNEAQRRDPEHRCRWVVLVDGQIHQLDLIQAELARRGLKVPLVLDVIHVLGYLWKAAWVFHPQGSTDAQDWVSHRLWRILQGRARVVAAEMRSQATRLGLEVAKRKPVDKCADYLHHNAAYLDYPTALTAGMPIATGVIEGACRYLIKDRLEITGARWRLTGAEAVLQLRALVTSGDFDAYWQFHLRQEFLRNHAAHYLPTPPPMPIPKPEKEPELARIA
jgi:hypothetical protein